MSEIKPKKERRFLKTLGRVGEILVEQVLLKLGSSIIRKIGGKKTLPSILFLFLSLSLFAQFPNTGNKQRLGFQTTADGLTWRGSISDTASIQPINNQNAWVILDTINLKFYTFDFTSNVWNALPQGTNIDTTFLSNRIDLKLNISDTAEMLLPYATKLYVDTAGRFYARQDFINAQTSTLTWTQSDTLVPLGVSKIMVYRNGQILLPSQYTIPNKTTIIIAATSFKVGENYTVIFPKGGGGSGGGGGGGGSGSVTSISQGTGIIATPNPIVSIGSIAADTSFLITRFDTLTMLAPYFRDADTSLLNLTSRFETKQNILISGTNIKTVNSNSLLGSGNISVGTLVAADTVSLSNRINLKGTGTVTNIATGYGLTGGAITTTGTLLLDSAVVFSRIRDSIVDIAIGNDTIKIIKQEYAPALSSVLTFTALPKFPIQLKAFILVFRNGQLLNNEQYNLTDTNKITIVSSSFKLGSNYTVVTVSGIGSVGTGVFPNPVYPEAGIALSTGSAWASSIPNNSSNWNIAFNDKISNAAFTGTTTKTLTLTQTDGGTLTAPFTDLQGVTGVTAGTGLTGGTISTTGTVTVDFGVVAPLANPTFTGTVSGITKSMVGLGNVDNTSDANKPVSTATQTALNGKLNLTGGTLTGGLTGTNAVFSGTMAIGFPFAYKPLEVFSNVNDFVSVGVNQLSQFQWSGIHFGYREADIVYRKSAIVFQRNEAGPADASGKVHLLNVNSFEGGRNADLRDAKLTIGNNGFIGINDTTPSFNLDVNGTFNATGATTLGSTLSVSGNITEDGYNVLTNLDTASLSNRINNKVSLTGDETINGSKSFNNIVNVLNGMTISGSVSGLNKILGKITPENRVGEITVGSGLNLTNNVLNVNNKITDISTSEYSIASTDYYINNLNNASTTIILPIPDLNVYRELKFKNSSTGGLISNYNLIPLSGSGTTTTLLPATNAKWCTIVSDGTDWRIMESN